jgi:hypothetical protein
MRFVAFDRKNNSPQCKKPDLETLCYRIVCLFTAFAALKSTGFKTLRRKKSRAKKNGKGFPPKKAEFDLGNFFFN